MSNIWQVGRFYESVAAAAWLGDFWPPCFVVPLVVEFHTRCWLQQGMLKLFDCGLCLLPVQCALHCMARLLGADGLARGCALLKL